MKLTWGIGVILAAAIGMAGEYRLALAREHQRLEKDKELMRLAYRWISGENKEARDRMAHQIYADKFTEHDSCPSAWSAAPALRAPPAAKVGGEPA